jgi:drug/metabolite transporter (DMT)-like permease
VVSLEILREIWLGCMIAAGGLLCWWIYLAHYRAPESRKTQAPPSPASGGGAGGGGQPAELTAEAHEFPDGIQETNLPVPSALKWFYLGMAVLSIAYVLWIRFKVGSY